MLLCFWYLGNISAFALTEVQMNRELARSFIDAPVIQPLMIAGRLHVPPTKNLLTSSTTIPDDPQATIVARMALPMASPSPGRLTEPWLPPLNAMNPVMRMKPPRETSGIEWPEMGLTLGAAAGLDRLDAESVGWILAGKRSSRGPSIMAPEKNLPSFVS